MVLVALEQLCAKLNLERESSVPSYLYLVGLLPQVAFLGYCRDWAVFDGQTADILLG